VNSLLVEREKEIRKVLGITLVLNWTVALLKFIVGIQFGYLSLKSSGIESFFDGGANILALISITLASRPADADHNYGHHKYETLGSIIIGLTLTYSAIQVALDWTDLSLGGSGHANFGILPVASIVFSMIVSYFVSWYEGKKGRELNSSLLLADASHTYGDFIISFGVLASILLSYFGFLWPDVIFGGFICLYLFYLAYKIFKSNIPEMLDASPLIEEELIKSVENIDYVYDIHNFRARGNQNFMQVDFHLHLEPSLSLVQAHEVGKKVEVKMRTLLKDYSAEIDIIYHIEPYEDSK
jgi:cation diffusion facilitator family transporter